jgi:hypothetical protein
MITYVCSAQASATTGGRGAPRRRRCGAGDRVTCGLSESRGGFPLASTTDVER